MNNPWHPIETCPLDGTLVDLWHKTAGRLVDAWYVSEDKCFSNVMPIEDFTHWMAIPPDPIESKDSGMKKLPEDMMRDLRGRRGLDEEDTSKDAEILKMSPPEIVLYLSEWALGDQSWARVFARWMREAGAKPEDF